MDSQSMASQSRRQKGKGKASQGPTEKAHWDPKANDIFIKLCVEQVKAQNRPGTHFNKTGWDNINAKFFEQLRRNYSQVQFKNRWDVLKKDYGLWKSLKMGETGLGLDPETGAITTSDEWWRNKIQMYLDAAKFREKPLQYVDEMEIMFSVIYATGEHALTPNSGVLPPHMHLANDQEVQSEDYRDLNSPTLDDLTPDIEISQNKERTNKRGSEASSNQQCKGRKLSATNKLNKTLDRIVSAVESNAEASRRTNTQGCTIPEVLELLSKLPGVTHGDPLFMLGTKLFIYPQ